MAGGSRSLRAVGSSRPDLDDDRQRSPQTAVRSSDSLYDCHTRERAMHQSTSLLALVGVVGFALISLFLGIFP
jgi:hypothetical protein